MHANKIDSVRHGAFVNATITASVGLYSHVNSKRAHYLSLAMEMSTHPLFDKTWCVRHVLDQNSVLLKEDTRSLVKYHDNKWPLHFLERSIASHLLKYDTIVFYFGGTELDSGNDVVSLARFENADVVEDCVFDSMDSKDVRGREVLDFNKIDEVSSLREPRNEDQPLDEGEAEEEEDGVRAD